MYYRRLDKFLQSRIEVITVLFKKIGCVKKVKSLE